MKYYKKLQVFKTIKFSVQLKPYIIKIESRLGSALLHTNKNLFLYKNVICIVIPKSKNRVKTLFNSLFFRLKGLQFLYVMKLSLKGLGFKVTILENFITFKLGFSHLFTYCLPRFLKAVVYGRFMHIKLFSNNLQKLREVCIVIKKLKFPEPYKGKGIIYFGEMSTLKAIKKL